MRLSSFKLQLLLPLWVGLGGYVWPQKQAPGKSLRSRRKARPWCVKRAWCDSLIYSNVVYALAAIFSFSCGQKCCGGLQMGAAIASVMFHRSKETKFLLLDALISGLLGIIFIFTGQHTLINEWYGILSIKTLLGMLCAFTWIYCGLPGGKRYERWHKRWHYVSGATTISTTLFLTVYVPEFDLLMHGLIQGYNCFK
ncbi:hypothetical protein CCR75_009362 [Bremia lactucae]|uniref:Uncharacterized protein n=1 Tax=Bremia lactucae TaxID=4779 RepID=A0A976FI43_BRELC|nr:hypothetical protein CCR75_009362 [Bremia lactucae]